MIKVIKIDMQSSDIDDLGVHLMAIRACLDNLEPNRETAIVKTKIDEAMLWLGMYAANMEDEDDEL